MKEEKVIFSVSTPKNIKENLKKLSEVTRINQSKLVIEALEDLFKKHDLENK